jgi:hypothetical protein
MGYEIEANGRGFFELKRDGLALKCYRDFLRACSDECALFFWGTRDSTGIERFVVLGCGPLMISLGVKK